MLGNDSEEEVRKLEVSSFVRRFGEQTDDDPRKDAADELARAYLVVHCTVESQYATAKARLSALIGCSINDAPRVFAGQPRAGVARVWVRRPGDSMPRSVRQDCLDPQRAGRRGLERAAEESVMPLADLPIPFRRHSARRAANTRYRDS